MNRLKANVGIYGQEYYIQHQSTYKILAVPEFALGPGGVNDTLVVSFEMRELASFLAETLHNLYLTNCFSKPASGDI
jgi:hypothetical protein